MKVFRFIGLGVMVASTLLVFGTLIYSAFNGGVVTINTNNFYELPLELLLSSIGVIYGFMLSKKELGTVFAA